MQAFSGTQLPNKNQKTVAKERKINSLEDLDSLIESLSAFNVLFTGGTTACGKSHASQNGQKINLYINTDNYNYSPNTGFDYIEGNLALVQKLKQKIEKGFVAIIDRSPCDSIIFDIKHRLESVKNPTQRHVIDIIANYNLHAVFLRILSDNINVVFFVDSNFEQNRRRQLERGINTKNRSDILNSQDIRYFKLQYLVYTTIGLRYNIPIIDLDDIRQWHENPFAILRELQVKHNWVGNFDILLHKSSNSVTLQEWCKVSKLCNR